MGSTKVWWARFLASLVLPFFLVVGTYQASLLAPGAVKVASWEAFASAVFLLAVVPVAVLLLRSRFHLVARLALALVTVPVLLLAAFVVQVHATCEAQPTHIGVQPKPDLIASCN